MRSAIRGLIQEGCLQSKPLGKARSYVRRRGATGLRKRLDLAERPELVLPEDIVPFV